MNDVITYGAYDATTNTYEIVSAERSIPVPAGQRADGEFPPPAPLSTSLTDRQTEEL